MAKKFCDYALKDKDKELSDDDFLIVKAGENAFKNGYNHSVETKQKKVLQISDCNTLLDKESGTWFNFEYKLSLKNDDVIYSIELNAEKADDVFLVPDTNFWKNKIEQKILNDVSDEYEIEKSEL